MARTQKPRSRRRTYAKPVIARRRRLADVAEGTNIFVTGRTID